MSAWPQGAEQGIPICMALGSMVLGHQHGVSWWSGSQATCGYMGHEHYHRPQLQQNHRPGHGSQQQPRPGSHHESRSPELLTVMVPTHLVPQGVFHPPRLSRAGRVCTWNVFKHKIPLKKIVSCQIPGTEWNIY